MLQDDTEPVTPSQTILFKLLDSHLSSSSRANTSPSPHIFLVDSFRDYSRYAVISLRSGQDDARLPKVFEALVLVCEGLCSMGLASQERRDKGKGREVSVGGDEEVVTLMKREADGIVKPLIGTLPFIRTALANERTSSSAESLYTSRQTRLNTDKRVIGRTSCACDSLEATLGATAGHPHIRRYCRRRPSQGAQWG